MTILSGKTWRVNDRMQDEVGRQGQRKKIANALAGIAATAILFVSLPVPHAAAAQKTMPSANQYQNAESNQTVKNVSERAGVIAMLALVNSYHQMVVENKIKKINPLYFSIGMENIMDGAAVTVENKAMGPGIYGVVESPNAAAQMAAMREIQNTPSAFYADIFGIDLSPTDSAEMKAIAIKHVMMAQHPNATITAIEDLVSNQENEQKWSDANLAVEADTAYMDHNAPGS